MPLHVIPADDNDLTQGERRVLNKLKQLYSGIEDNAFLYVQPTIKRLEPDFVLIDACRGLCIIEVKDWSRDYIIQIDRKHVTSADGRRQQNPGLKARRYYNVLKSLLEDQDMLLDEQGQPVYRLVSRLIMPNLDSESLEELGDLFHHYPASCLSGSQLPRLTIDTLFEQQPLCNLSQRRINVLRGAIFPEIRLPIKPSGPLKQCDIFGMDFTSLDVEQEKFAKRMSYGHYMVTGIPGSGKTVVLIARAIYLLSANPYWKIRIVTFTNALANKIRQRIDKLSGELANADLDTSSIEVSTFHKLARDVAGISIPRNSSAQFWDHELPALALEKAEPCFDAMLIDEYQDFEESWITLCLRLTRRHTFDGNHTETLFLAGDRLQTIYQRKEHSWKALGVNIVGRSKLFKISYRTGSQHISAALDYLMRDPRLVKEVETFYEGPENIATGERRPVESLEVLRGDTQLVIERLDALLNQGYQPNDIMLLTNSNRDIETLYRRLPPRLRELASTDKKPSNEKLSIITYHSSKGLECKVCFMMDVNRLEEPKLVYVAMTRASEKLFIHALPHAESELFEVVAEHTESPATALP